MEQWPLIVKEMQILLAIEAETAAGNLLMSKI
jgi:hypothetical protein